MAAFYVVAGVNHFINPRFYYKMVVDFLPYPDAVVAVSGVIEILCGVGLMIPQTRLVAAWATIALLLAIFPANIYMALHPEKWGFSTVALYLRLPIQLLLIWWAYTYTRA